MSNFKCPGQDGRKLDEDEVFDIECAHCGHAIEFFKDDAARRCPHCGERVSNPKISLGCAQWCEYAEECLGFDPKKMPTVEGQDVSLTDKLVKAMKAEFGDDQKRITHALEVLEAAEELLKQEDAKPRVVVAAALLHDIGIQQAEREHGSTPARYQEQEGPPIARRILEDLKVDEDTIKHVCRIVGSHHSANDIDTTEFRVVFDADWLVNMPAERDESSTEKLRGLVENTLRTKAGRAVAAERLSTSTRQSD